ncbi:response regulator transcription factor [Curtobacterium sp. MCBA15_001]|uniref:response regulator transcription factor n=1 Tax=Curtobacterium sp. MCBA15_001 TaxID=1898731 RepID=UPI0020C8B17D|nr:response regulator transcription factor [Curtobacterium sp. MCBA15_001]
MDAPHGLVVVAEDEPAIADVERLYLRDAGFSVVVARDGQDALALIRRSAPVAAVLDIGLPGLDGIAILRALRTADDWTPVVLVTARDAEVDRVLGIELGADDYLTKPFSGRELAARVRGLVRRTQLRTGAVLGGGRLQVDRDRHRVTVDGTPVALTATEFALLAHLVAEPGRVFERAQLLSTVWGVADFSGTRTVDVHVAQLRAKLGDAAGLRTVRGVGYAYDPSGAP